MLYNPVCFTEPRPSLALFRYRPQRGFVYAEIRAELAARGVPPEEVAFIHDHETKARRDALFAAVNDGRVRVRIGSTAKMSAGMNVQRRLIALHDLDCPWRPGDRGAAPRSHPAPGQYVA